MSKKDNPIHLALFQTFAALLLEFLKVVTTQENENQTKEKNYDVFN